MARTNALAPSSSLSISIFCRHVVTTLRTSRQLSRRTVSIPCNNTIPVSCNGLVALQEPEKPQTRLCINCHAYKSCEKSACPEAALSLSGSAC